MPTPLTEQGILSRRRAQEVDIYFREDFLHAGRPTQQEITRLLREMTALIEQGREYDAQQYFFTEVSEHTRSRNTDCIDKDGVDWREVDDQIKHFCFSEHDMDGYIIVPRRVEQSLVVFQCLMDLDLEDSF